MRSGRPSRRRKPLPLRKVQPRWEHRPRWTDTERATSHPGEQPQGRRHIRGARGGVCGRKRLELGMDPKTGETVRATSGETASATWGKQLAKIAAKTKAGARLASSTPASKAWRPGEALVNNVKARSAAAAGETATGDAHFGKASQRLVPRWASTKARSSPRASRPEGSREARGPQISLWPRNRRPRHSGKG